MLSRTATAAGDKIEQFTRIGRFPKSCAVRRRSSLVRRGGTRGSSDKSLRPSTGSTGSSSPAFLSWIWESPRISLIPTRMNDSSKSLSIFLRNSLPTPADRWGLKFRIANLRNATKAGAPSPRISAAILESGTKAGTTIPAAARMPRSRYSQLGEEFAICRSVFNRTGPAGRIPSSKLLWVMRYYHQRLTSVC